METKTETKETKNKSVVAALEQLLADSYALMGQLHLAHWNVEGPSFFQLHEAFQTQYEELFPAIDDIAERIRALDALSPGGLATLAKASSVEELAAAHLPARDYVAHLIKSHEVVAASAEALRDAAGEASDVETEDMAIARVQVHQKTLWMLRSFVKNM